MVIQPRSHGLVQGQCPLASTGHQNDRTGSAEAEFDSTRLPSLRHGWRYGIPGIEYLSGRSEPQQPASFGQTEVDVTDPATEPAAGQARVSVLLLNGGGNAVARCPPHDRSRRIPACAQDSSG